MDYNIQYDVFISYRRDGGEYTARVIYDKLTELGYSVFFDVESLRSGDFNTKLYDVIDNCKDFIIVLSPNALDRCVNEDDWVKKEVEHAIKQNKNIVPILLRGFTFPDNLPESIAALPRYNGIEANSQFFDAFISRLKEFLISKPPLANRIKQNPMFSKTLPLIVAAAVVAAAFLGIRFFADKANAAYPRTNAEKNITDAVVETVITDLTNIVIAADYSYSFIDKAENYIAAGETNFDELVNEYNIARIGIADVKNGILPLSQEMIDKLYDTRFSPSDVESFNSQSTLFCDEWLGNIKYLRYVASDDCYLADSEKLELLSLYRTILDETISFYSSCYVNGILMPVTNSDALELFFTNIKNLRYHSVTRENWTSDETVLVDRIDIALNGIEAATQKLAAINGNENTETAEIKKGMVQTYMMLGYSKEEAQQLTDEYQQKVNSIIAKQEEIRFMCLPAENDNMDTLWYKMNNLLALGYYDDARDCADAFMAIANRSDVYAAEYMPRLYWLIDYMYINDTFYGVMVTGYAEEEHPLLKIGDIITAFNGQPCYSYEEYISLKQNLAADSYTVDVVRIDADKNLTEFTFDIDKTMPPVALSTLVYHENTTEH